MRRFYCKAVLFVLIMSVLLVGVEYLSVHEDYRYFLARVTDSEEYITVNTGADEIRPYIEKVREKNGYTKLILGDSVCHQMYNGLQDLNEEYCIVGSNAAITLSGQYILAEQFLENHENVTDIYLILIPSSLGATYDTNYGYQYAVMPFVETDTLKLLDENTIGKMETVYGKLFMNDKVVWLIDRSGINRKVYLNELSKRKRVKSEGPISEASIQYIQNMKLLCDSKGVELHLLPGPFADIEARHELVNNRMRKVYEESILQEYFPDFLDQVSFFPEEQFRDEIHFGGEYANQQAYNEKIREMYIEKGLLEGLRLE